MQHIATIRTFLKGKYCEIHDTGSQKHD